MGKTADSAHDWVDGFSHWKLSIQLALEDIRDRYRRSLLGVLWITLSFLLFIGIKAFVFSSMNAMSIGNFTQYLTIGFALWTLINTLLVDGAATFVRSRTWVLSSSLPYVIYILQSVFRSYLNFLLVAVAAIIILAFSKIQLHSAIWTLVPAFILYFLTGLWVSALLAPLCARYRDVLYALQTVMRMMFFATPIIWTPEAGTMRGVIAFWNPFTHYLSIIREPLLYGTIPTQSWMIVGGISFVGLILAWVTYTTTRDRIAFWV
ncbi:MAG: hypothetical protein COA84_15545 [Robiginitomaculum sp.]|nr:MAG: hypothetical protein COA84_15545 [Robiginitomaculum sp.]